MMMLRRGTYTTQDDHQATFTTLKDGIPGGLAHVLHVGFVAYDEEGKPEVEETPVGLTLKLETWEPLPEDREKERKVEVL